jgi:hypothetical protein
MRRTLIPAAAGVVLVASAGFAFAQVNERGHGPGGGGGGPATRGAPSGPHVGPPGGRSPGAGPGMTAPRSVERPRASEPSMRRVEPGRGEPMERREGRRSIDRDRRETGPVERNRRAVERDRGERSAERERERSRAAERAGKERRAEEARRKSAEQAEERRRRSAGQPSDKGPDGANRSNRVASERYEEVRRARTRLSSDERRRLHDSFDMRRGRITNARFDWHVGRRIPRHVRLFAVPAAVLAFFPYYRDYRYFVVDDEVCIVDPATYEVVDVIDSSYRGGPRPEIAQLSLAPAQIAIVRDGIAPDFPVARVRLRLALGAELPGDVELHRWPVIVVERVPELQDYRFLVTEDQIVIVRPSDRSIALVVDR